MKQSIFKKLQTLSISSIASIIMLVVTLVVFGIAFIPTHSFGLLKTKFLEGHAELFNFYDSAYQRLGHKVGLLILALSVLGAVIMKRRQSIRELILPNLVRNLVKQIKLYAGGLFLLVILLVVMLNYGYPTFSRSVDRLVILPFFLVILFILLRRIIPKSYILLAAWLGNIGYIYALTVPGFLTNLRMRSEELAAVQCHYLVLSFADRLAINSQYFAQWLPNYGLMLSSLLGAYQKHFGLLNFGQHIRLIQVFQVIFLLIAFLALYLWKPRRPVYILFALLFFGVYVGTTHQSIFYPNQSGWRFLGFPLWVLSLLLVRNMPLKPLSWILGCSSGLFLLFNLETGIVITLCSFIFLISRIRLLLWRKMLSGLMSFVIGAMLVILFFGIIFFMEFGRFPFSASLWESFGLLKAFLAGYGGFPLEFNLLVIFIFMHCVYLVATILITWSLREISAVLSIKLAIASSVLIWFGYYMNRGASWNLWTIFFLYSFLLVDFLNFKLMLFLWRKRGLLSLIDIRVAVFSWILLPSLLLSYELMPATQVLGKASKSPKNIETAVISGVRLPVDIVSALEKKVKFVKTLSDSDKTIFLTRDSFIILLMTKKYNLLDVQDVYMEYREATKFEYLVRNLRVINPKYILVDEPFSILSAMDFASAYRLKFYNKIMRALSDRYRKVGAESDWIIWERVID